MKNLFVAILALLFLLPAAQAQDVDYARRLITDLASPQMHGRGYVKNGDGKAAKYIRSEFRKVNAPAFNGKYFQQYSFGINTFPYKLLVDVDGQELEPGSDYILSSASPALKGTFELLWLLNDSLFEYGDERFEGVDVSDKFIVTDTYHKGLKKENYFGSRGVIFLKEDDANMWWHVSNGRAVLDHVVLDIRRSCLPENASKISLDIRNKFIEDYSTRNVVAWIPGTVQPDTFIVFTAHYDHLGRMGAETFFPGANDNASGTAMVIDMARHYALEGNEPYYSMVFIALSGEESGLNGSYYFAEHPLFPLEKVKVLVNLDMVGTGSKGITLVNGKVYQDDYDRLAELNEQGGYLEKVKIRGESCNSDHCPFFQKGVKAFFIYAMGGGAGGYHCTNDTPENLSLAGYEGIFRLLTDFVDSYIPKP